MIFRPILDSTVAAIIFRIFLTTDSCSATSIYPRKVIWQTPAGSFDTGNMPMVTKGDWEKNRVLKGKEALEGGFSKLEYFGTKKFLDPEFFLEKILFPLM